MTAATMVSVTVPTSAVLSLTLTPIPYFGLHCMVMRNLILA